MHANAGRAYGKKDDVITCINKLFAVKKPVIGCLHLLALPGAPLYGGSMRPFTIRLSKKLQPFQNMVLTVLSLRISGISLFIRGACRAKPSLRSPQSLTRSKDGTR